MRLWRFLWSRLNGNFPSTGQSGRALGRFSRCSYSARQQEVFEVKEDVSVF